MKKMMKRAAAAIAVSAALFGVSQEASAQLVVVDPSAIANMVSQLAQMAAQLNQMKTEYSAITGVTGMGGLLSSQMTNAQSNIPTNWESQYQNGSAAPSSSSTYGQMQAQMQSMGRTDAMTYARNQREQKAGTDQAMIQKSYNQQLAEIQNLQELTAQINSATTPKQVQDLQARIATAKATLAVEQQQLQAMQMQMKTQDQMNNDASEEAAKRWALGDDGEEPTSPSITGSN
jgi:type IV secretion system protein VirB5